MSLMPKSKLCDTCSTKQSPERFQGGRNTCTACRTELKQIRDSASYKSYLNNLLQHCKSAVKRGARTTEHDMRLELDDLVQLWVKQEGKCALSGVFLTHHKDGSGRKDCNASIDRIANSKSYSKENVQLVCYRVNIMKHSLGEGEFYWWIKNLHDFSCD